MLFGILFIVVGIGACFILSRYTDEVITMCSLFIMFGIFIGICMVLNKIGVFDLDTVSYSKDYAIEQTSVNESNLLSSGDTVSILVKDGDYKKQVKVPSKVVKYINGNNPSIQIKGLQVEHPSDSEKFWFCKGYGGLPDNIDKSTVVDDIVYEEVIITYPQK